MAKNNETSITFKVFNQDFNKAMSEMNAASKTLRQELKLEQEQLKLNGTESQKLESSLGNLQKQFELAQQKTQATADQLEAVKRQFGENSTEVSRMETALRRAQIAEQQLANRITTTTQELEQARQAESEATQESNSRRQSLQQLQSEQNNLRSSSQRLTSEYELQRAQMSQTASEEERVAAAETHLRQQADLTRQTINNLERQLSLTEQEYGRNSTEANQMASRLNAARTSVANLENEISHLRDGENDAADGMDELGRRISAGNFMQAAEILSGAADKVKELGKSAIDSATEMADSQQDIQNNFGMTAKEAAAMQNVVKNVFEHGVTDSVETASKAVQDVKSYMGDLNNTDLEKVTNKVIGIGKHTDTDVNENVRAASQLMNHFGVSADESLDLIAAGFQNGLNKSDDFLDTLNEYSPQFAQAGFSAKDMLNVINSGMKSGAFNTDKAADAVKEFGLKLKDGTIAKNIGLYSQHTQDLFKKFQDGKATSAQVFQSINKDIAGTDDKTKKYNMGVDAMGTQYEDLGDKAVAAFAKTGNSITDVTGKADQMSKRSPGEKWQQSLRELRDSLSTIGKDLIADLTPIINVIGDIAKGFSNIPAPVRILIEVLGGLLVAITLLAPVIAAITVVFGAFSMEAGVLTLSIGSLEVAILPIVAVIAAVIAVIVAVIAIIKNWGAIVDWLKGVWSDFSAWIGNLWTGIKAVIQTAWTAISGWLSTAWQAFIAMVSPIWNGLVNVFKFIWELIKSVFQAGWTIISSLITAAWNVFIALAQPIWQPLAAFFSALWNGIKTVTVTVWNGLKATLLTIWNAIKTVASSVFNTIKKVVSTVWNSIKSVTSTVWNGIKSVVLTVWNAIKSTVTTAVNAVKSVISKIWNSIKSTTSSVWNGIKSVISTVWSGIKSSVSTPINWIKSHVSSVWNSIRSATSSVWGRIRSAIETPINAAKNTVSRVISSIKGFFSGLHLSIPGIHMPPLPHFHLNGHFSLNPPSVPHLSVDWYKNGGIFDQASIIGIGEAGKEAALPLVGNAMNPFADAIANRMLSTLPQIAESQLAKNVANNNHIEINATVRNDADMNRLLDRVDDALGNKTNRLKAAWGGLNG